MVLIYTRSRFSRVHARSRREYRANRTSVYRACDREGERVAIASLCVAVPRRFPIIGNVGGKAQCVRRLPTSHVAHLSLPCVPACFDRFISHARVCRDCSARIKSTSLLRARVCARIVCARINMPSFCLSARINTVNIKCRKCLVSVVNAIKRECLFAVSRVIVFLQRPRRDIKLNVVCVVNFGECSRPLIRWYRLP